MVCEWCRDSKHDYCDAVDGHKTLCDCQHKPRAVSVNPDVGHEHDAENTVLQPRSAFLPKVQSECGQLEG